MQTWTLFSMWVAPKDRRRSLRFAKAWILVEDHRHATGMHLNGLVDRSSATHEERTSDQCPRSVADCIPRELMSDLTESDSEMAMVELRPPGQQCIYFKPRVA